MKKSISQQGVIDLLSRQIDGPPGPPNIWLLATAPGVIVCILTDLTLLFSLEEATI